MWPALLFPVVVLSGTLFMERFEATLLGPKSERVQRSPRGEQVPKSPLWTIIIPQDAVSGQAGRSRPAADAFSPAGGAELEVSSGAVTG